MKATCGCRRATNIVETQNKDYAMKGMHPDVVFGEARRAIERDPYVRAMDKFREAYSGGRMRKKEQRDALLADPDRYGLTPEEVDAVKKVSTQ